MENPEYAEEDLPAIHSKESQSILSASATVRSQANGVLENAEKNVSIRELRDFDSGADMDYFRSLEGKGGWIAIGMDDCMNQQYYVAIGENDEKLGIVGVYDTEDAINFTHVVIDPEYRSTKTGKSLLPDFYSQLLKKTGLKSLVATINPRNIASIRSHEKAGFREIDVPKYDWKLIYEYDIE